jgi:hypothetical protein
LDGLALAGLIDTGFFAGFFAAAAATRPDGALGAAFLGVFLSAVVVDFFAFAIVRPRYRARLPAVKPAAGPNIALAPHHAHAATPGQKFAPPPSAT